MSAETINLTVDTEKKTRSLFFDDELAEHLPNLPDSFHQVDRIYQRVLASDESTELLGGRMFEFTGHPYRSRFRKAG